MVFRRGFKTWCERVSTDLRSDLGIGDASPLPSRELAAHLNAELWSPRELVGLSAETLEAVHRESEDWSAATVLFDGVAAVIYNPWHSAGRRSSDIMHELSHLLLKHDPATVILSADGLLAFRSFNKDQEDEAAWLSGSLLLPRPALMHIANSGMTDEAAMVEYEVSSQLLIYRRNITGVASQLKHRRRRRAKLVERG